MTFLFQIAGRTLWARTCRYCGGMPRDRRHLRRRGAALLVVLAVPLGLMACSSTSDAGPPTPSPTVATPTPPAGPTTIATLIENEREEPEVTLLGPAAPVGKETAQALSYSSGGLEITGVLRLPAGDGPFPLVVAVHGSVDPADYESGRDMVPEQRALLDAGYAVLATDLRGYAGSDPAEVDGTISVDPGFGWATVLDWGMALDVVNALAVARSGQLPQVDPSSVGLLGHSLGGLLSLDAAVVAPELAELVIVLAAPTSDLATAVASAVDPDSPEWELLAETVGTPDDNPEYWRDISPVTFFSRAQAPLLLVHGSADDVAPARWAQETKDAWLAAGGRAELVLLEGGDHHLEPRRAEASAVIVQAFDAVLR